MKETNPYMFYNSQKIIALVMFAMCFSGLTYSQETETEQDSTSTGFTLGSINLPNPGSIVSKYTYDPITDRYIYTETVGNFNINYPIILTPKEFERLVLQENLKSYYKQKIDAADGKKEGSEDIQKNLLPDFYVNSDFFESIFGSNEISVTPQGSVEMDLGVLFTKQDNPSFSPRNRRNFSFDFDQRISLSLLGKVGTRLQVTANYDTQSTFDFQNLVKLEYTPTEDDILQKIEVGNVSMPLNSSLISGAQSLFGVKTELQFGKTRVTAVFSEQKSQTRTVTAQGGGTLEEFQLFARDYDENRHFFLAHYFRDNYDQALSNYPYINTNVQITRVEVWVTNRSNRTENVRNIVAVQDLGETTVLGSAVNVLPGASNFPDNSNNGYDPTNIGGPGSQLTDAIRDIAIVQNGFLVTGVNEGFDYNKLENARKLTEGQEYTLSTELGYISLNQRLNNDEVLAVAFQFTVGGEVFQVGEFANDGVDATDVGQDINGNQTITNQNLVLKMLKSSITNVQEPIWDLMMKNIYDIGAFQLSQEDFKLNIFYTETSPLNYITPTGMTAFPNQGPNVDPIEQTTLLRLFNLDRLNFNNDPQIGGDGFFDFVPGITVLTQNGKIIFTNAEPFGEYLFDRLSLAAEDYDNENTYNENQQKYVYNTLYSSTKTAALEDFEKNKFELRGRYKSQGGGGISLGAFNVPRGSVKVTAGGRTLVEGIDYTVNYQIGTVQIIDPALEASNTPIQVSVENNAIFGQQTRRFTGVNVEHQFNENFVLGATVLNLNERPITQKANYNSEPINNTIFGFNGNYSTEVPFLTRLANKLPNIDTDAPSNFSVRGEFAYLAPGAPKGTNFNGEATSYIDDFEGSQNSIDLRAPQSWFLSSRPLEINGTDIRDIDDIDNGFERALLNWYTIDPIFYTNQRPSGIGDDDVSNLYTRRVFIEEIFPQIDIVQGQQAVVNTLDLSYYPAERGPYNFEPDATDGVLDNPNNNWGGITRQLTTTDFEQSNVEYIEFWMQDPFLDNTANPGGTLSFNLGNISEDVLADGRKQYENGLPDGTSNNNITTPTPWGVVPANQSLIYAFDTTGDARSRQDIGYDGLDDIAEGTMFPGFGPEDPSNDNYQYYLNRNGDIFERYKLYNGQEGNSPETITDTNRGSTTQPDVEDINRDNTMNTINSYFEYNIPISPMTLSDVDNDFIRDRKVVEVTLPNGSSRTVTWYQFRIPTNVPLATFDDIAIPEYKRYNGIADFRSIRFIRMYLQDFSESTVLRFGSLDLVRGDWRRYTQALDGSALPPSDDTEFSQGVVSIQENEGSYVSPPGVEREELFNNNTIQRQNEQSLVLNVCDLAPKDGRALYKNINVDMRQYKRLRMFMHAEEGTTPGLSDGDLVGFIRMGNDFTQNFYQIEIPLQVSNGTSPSEVWPDVNEINLPLELLQEIKSRGISAGTLNAVLPTYYDEIDGQLSALPVPEGSPRTLGQLRLAIKGNPNFGDIRTLMVGVKNGGGTDVCGQVWFNELRISDLDNEGGWAAVLSMDGNIADFANVTATGRQSTTGFGTIEQGPNERSREDVKQYDVVTNVNIGQLLPKKWGVQIPFNYAQSEEIITPEFDQQYKDLKLDTRLANATSDQEREIIKKQSEDYTKRKSINFIGVKKQRTGDSKPRFYDVENFTFNYSFNQVEHRDFEIENSLDQSVRVGANYSYNFNPITIEPFKKNDSLFTGKYWKFLKDFNVNLLPTSFTVTTDINRLYNKQKFREVDLTGGNIGLEELFRRNYTFDFAYTLNYNITKSLQTNFTASNNNIVRNYFVNDIINGRQDSELDIWDGFFDFGDPNRQYQQFGLTYELPFDKIPTFSFLSGTYSYTGDFQWQKGSDLFGNIDGFDLGNNIQNSNTHNLNTTLDMKKFYKYLGLVKKPLNAAARANSNRIRNGASGPPGVKNEDGKNNKKAKKPKSKAGIKLYNAFVDVITSVKRIQVNYTENNGTFLPGYLQTPGFIGTLKPTLGYTFGSQRDIRELAARNGWLTIYDQFNQQYTQVENKILDISANLEPVRDLKIDIIANRRYSENLTENFIVEDFTGPDINNDGIGDPDGVLDYNPLIKNTFGNFDISTLLIGTAFSKSDEFNSQTFDNFRTNRLIVANRLARARGIDLTNPANIDADGFPVGYGKTNQAVLLPAFLSAYSGQSADKVKLGAFRNVPIPNWNLKYTGFMKFKWFKKHFKRFSLTHGYRSSYTINQFRTNLEGVQALEDDAISDFDTNGNFYNRELFSNINLMEQFSPLVRLDFEMKNSVKILAEIKKDRVLSLSFDNNLLTEIIGSEYIIGLGYRIKDVKFKSKLAGPNQTIKSDLNMKADISLRDNKTIVRYLDLDNNQITSGQTIWGLKFSSDYAFSKNLTGIFYFDYTFSDYAISTAFPQTTIRSGLTLRYNFGN